MRSKTGRNSAARASYRCSSKYGSAEGFTAGAWSRLAVMKCPSKRSVDVGVTAFAVAEGHGRRAGGRGDTFSISLMKWKRPRASAKVRQPSACRVQTRTLAAVRNSVGEVAEGLIPVGIRLLGQAQHPFADDVALHLV